MSLHLLAERTSVTPRTVLRRVKNKLSAYFSAMIFAVRKTNRSTKHCHFHFNFHKFSGFYFSLEVFNENLANILKPGGEF